MNKSDGKCELCSNNESLCHVLAECNDIKPMWQKINRQLTDATNYDFDLNCVNIVFGIKEIEPENIKDTQIIYNFVIYFATWCIQKHCNNVKFGNETKKDCETSFPQVINCCRQEFELIKKSKVKSKLSYIILKKLSIFADYEI